MSGKNLGVAKFPVCFKGTCPCIEGLFSNEDMDVMIDKILRNENSLIGKGDHQRIFALRMLQPDKLDASPIDLFNSRHNDVARPFCVGSNDVPTFLVLLRSHAVSNCFDLRFHLCKCIDRNLKYNRTEEVIWMIVSNVKP